LEEERKRREQEERDAGKSEVQKSHERVCAARAKVFPTALGTRVGGAYALSQTYPVSLVAAAAVSRRRSTPRVPTRSLTATGRGGGQGGGSTGI
jgi:hypothetical protein